MLKPDRLRARIRALEMTQEEMRLLVVELAGRIDGLRTKLAATSRRAANDESADPNVKWHDHEPE